MGATKTRPSGKQTQKPPLDHIAEPLRDLAVDITKLVTDPANARKHPEGNLSMIKTSLRVYGQRKPLVVNQRNNIIEAGNGTFEAAKALGWSHLAVVYVDDDHTTATGFSIADNRSGELAEWDKEALGHLLSEMVYGDDELQSAFGDLADQEGIGQLPGDIDAEPQIDRAAELQKKWDTRAGQLWLIGSHRLLCGDSTKREDVKRVMGGEKPLLMVTDPPYGVDYDPVWRAEAGINKNQDKMGKVQNDGNADWTAAWELFQGDVAYVYHAGAKASIVQGSLERAGFVIRAQIVWAKDRMALGRGDYHWQHEPIWYAVREGRPANRTGDRTQTTLWNIQARDDSGHGHGTQKPLECMTKPIYNHHFKLVYDPFLGTGTTLVAAENLQRRCLGIEISPAYCAVILERMAMAFPNLSIQQA